MCLWEEVVAWDAQRIVLRSQGHRHPAHPLRSHDRLRAVHLCEYGAQAMAVHGGLMARERGSVAPPGMLVALRGVELQCDRIDDLPGALECEAEALIAGEGAQQYRFVLRHAGVVLAEGRAAVILETPE
ncbi:MAG TPA: phosphotransferase [Lysobacter sp.]|nr:phosphotransferase [Lysobacter sp.]